MNQTSHSLLGRLKDSSRTSDDWNHLLDIYSPLIRSWLRKYEIQHTDANDLVQEVLLTVHKDIGKFDHNGRQGAFRGWLKAILVNRLRNFWRSRDRQPRTTRGGDIDSRLDQLADPSSEMSRIWNREHDQFVLRQLLSLTEPHFAPNTWKAFCRVAIDREKPAFVAEGLGITLNAVCLAKSRVIRRLRQEAAGLVESSSSFFSKS